MKKLLVLTVLACAANSLMALSPYIGANAGYLVDSEKEYLTARVGIEFAKTQKLSHNVEFEIGRYSDGNDYGSEKLLPLMLNYRGVVPVTKNLSIFVSAGGGVSIVDIEATVYRYQSPAFQMGNNLQLVGGYVASKESERSNSLSAQGLAGVEYRVARSLSVVAGARYLWIGDAKFLGQTFRVGDDVSLEGGLSYKF